MDSMVFKLEEFSDIQTKQLNTLGYISPVDRLPEEKLSWPPLANLDQKVNLFFLSKTFIIFFLKKIVWVFWYY